MRIYSQGQHSEESIRASPSWFKFNPENILAHRLYLWTVQNTRLLNYSQNNFISLRLKVIQLVGFP